MNSTGSSFRASGTFNSTGNEQIMQTPVKESRTNGYSNNIHVDAKAMQELKALSNPPQLVNHVWACTMILLGEKAVDNYWKLIGTKLKNTAEFVAELQSVDPTKMPASRLSSYKKYLNKHQLAD